MEADDLPEEALFAAVRALILLGLPVATFDYDDWLDFDDVEWRRG